MAEIRKIVDRDGLTLTANIKEGTAKWHIDPEALKIEQGQKVIWLRPIIKEPPGEGLRKFCVYEGEIYQIISTGPGPDGSIYTFLQYAHAPETGDATMYLLHGGEIGSANPTALYKVEGAEQCTGDATCKHCAECPECASLHCEDHNA